MYEIKKKKKNEQTNEQQQQQQQSLLQEPFVEAKGASWKSHWVELPTCCTIANAVNAMLAASASSCPGAALNQQQ